MHLYDLVYIFLDFGRFKLPVFPVGKLNDPNLDG
jgi:hypothetical protein